MAHKQACDVCHKRKIQCDSTDQSKPCNWCEHHGLACTFHRVRGRRKKRDKARASDATSRHGISERLQALEATIASTISQRSSFTGSLAPSANASATPPSVAPSSFGRLDTPDTPSHSHAAPASVSSAHASRPLYAASPLGGDTTSVAFGQIHFGGYHFGKISHHNGMPILSEEGRQWISSRTGENVSFDRFRPIAAHNAWMDKSIILSHEEAIELPDRIVIEQALDGYLNAACRLIFPVVDPVLFRDTIADAYDDTEEQVPVARLASRCCVLAFLSLAILFRTTPELMPDLDSDTIAMRAHHYLPDVMEENSIVGLQAMIMLNIYQASTGRLQAAAMIHAVTCRSVFMLGGHAYRPIKPYTANVSHQERESRQLRLFFWLCYIFDKDISLRMNQPPLMSEDYCDLTLPEGYVNSYLFLPESDPCLNARLNVDETPVPLFPGELRLSQFKAKTTRLLYSAQAVNKTEAELFQDIRELDDELERWRLSIIPEYRPSLSISEATAASIMLNGPLPMRGMRRIVMHLEYHHLMTTIHRASGRCSVTSDAAGSSPVRLAGVKSSIDLTIEASRSTLVFLKTATRGLEAVAFWAMVFYPTVAIMAIFLNVLHYPLAPTVESDLELLASAATTIRSMPLPRLSRREVAHLDMMDEFVAELVRLGNSAVQLELRRQQERGAGRLGC